MLYDSSCCKGFNKVTELPLLWNRLLQSIWSICWLCGHFWFLQIMCTITFHQVRSLTHLGVGHKQRQFWVTWTRYAEILVANFQVSHQSGSNQTGSETLMAVYISLNSHSLTHSHTYTHTYSPLTHAWVSNESIPSRLIIMRLLFFS